MYLSRLVSPFLEGRKCIRALITTAVGCLLVGSVGLCVWYFVDMGMRDGRKERRKGWLKSLFVHRVSLVLVFVCWGRKEGEFMRKINTTMSNEQNTTF